MSFFSCSKIVNSFAFYPDQKYILTKKELPSYILDVDLVAKDGTQIHALYLKHNKKPKNVILYFHGNAGNVYDRISEGQQLYNRGYDVLICEYRGYGRSKGSPSEDGIYLDASAAWEYLTKKIVYLETEIFIYGRSLGSAVAIQTANIYNPAGMILITPFSSGYDVARDGGMGFLSIFALGSFDSMDKIKKMKTPLLIFHGDQDEIISFELGKKLFNAYNGKKEFIEIKGASHNDISVKNAKKYWDKVSDFVKKHQTKDKND